MVSGKLIIYSPDLDMGRPVIIPTLGFRRISRPGFLVREWLVAVQAMPALAERGQSRPRADAQPGHSVEQGPIWGQVGAYDTRVEVYRRPQRRPGEIRLSAVG